MSPSVEQNVVTDHISEVSNLKVRIDDQHIKLPTMYWIPKLHKQPYKARFIANSSSCTTTNISKLLTSCLTAIKAHVKRYCDKVYENSGKHLFWSIKNSGEILDKFKIKNYKVTSVSTYDFSTLYTTLPHNLINDKLTALIQKTFARENATFLACNFDKAFFTSCIVKHYTMWTCDEVCKALSFLLNNIYVRFGNAVFRQVIGIPMGTNCAPLVADLFLYCYERDFMLSLSPDTQANIITAFNNTSRYLDDILNMDNPFFSQLVDTIYPQELQLNKTNNLDTGASFLDLNLSIYNNFIHTKIYDKRDDFNFSIVNFPHLDGDVPHATSYGVYISQLIRFARACSHVEDFNERNQYITNKLLQQGYRYYKLRKYFAKFYYRNSDLVLKFNSSLKTLLREGISKPDFYGDVVYKLRKILGHGNFPTVFAKIIKRYVKRGYDPTVLRHTACLVFNPFTVGRYASLFDCV